MYFAKLTVLGEDGSETFLFSERFTAVDKRHAWWKAYAWYEGVRPFFYLPAELVLHKGEREVPAPFKAGKPTEQSS